MIVLDIDHFKFVNDEYGHVTGDQALIRLVTLLRTQLHHDEKIYRIGGEEFVIVPINHNKNDTFEFADRLRKFIEHSNLLDNVPVTVSIGVANYVPGEPTREWLKRADEALYAAKRNGRNCTQAAA
jgi:diguanylate cyclase (GGDEF)-like protein